MHDVIQADTSKYSATRQKLFAMWTAPKPNSVTFTVILITGKTSVPYPNKNFGNSTLTLKYFLAYLGLISSVTISMVNSPEL